jgi:hypothetical protein
MCSATSKSPPASLASSHSSHSRSFNLSKQPHLSSLKTIQPSFNMHFTALTIIALATSLASAQTLNIPARVGNVQRALRQTISANRDFGNAEFDSGTPCNTGEGGAPVFILEDGVTISNLIIGPNQVDGKSRFTLLPGPIR